jgi:hypothetical protein
MLATTIQTAAPTFQRTFTTTTPLTGYKIVDARCCSVYFGQPCYRVGHRYSLHPHVPIQLRLRGFHFCTDAIGCLQSVQWKDGYHLLRVTVPEGVDVQTDGKGQCAARTIVVDADVTDSVPARLTGLVRRTLRNGTDSTYYRNGRPSRPDGEPAHVLRAPRRVEKDWDLDGKPYGGLQGQYSRCVWTDGPSHQEVTLYLVGMTVPIAVDPSHPDWDAVVELATRVESVERDPPTNAFVVE